MHRYLARGRCGRGFSPSMAMAFIALLIALGGTSYAAITLPANSVGSKQIKKKAVTLSKIAPAARTALKGKAGPIGAAGAKGATGATGATGAAGATGAPGPFPATLPAGKTLVGTFGLGNVAAAAGGAGSQALTSISFPYPLAAAPTVDVIPPAGVAPAGCSGTVNSPGAASGHLCIFVGLAEGSPGALLVVRPDGGGSGGHPHGAVLAMFATAAGAYDRTGTWAVTG